ISGQNISIIHEDGSNITSPIEDIIQQSTESIVEYNNLYENFINNEEWDTMLQNFELPEIPNIQENVEITEVLLEENTHEIEDRVQMNSPYQGTDEIQIFDTIITKIQVFGKKKNKRISRIEALFYLEQLRERNRNNKRIARYICTQLTHLFGETKAYRL
ncbi:26458_t:CDS:2, partial [Racocetra persica]